MEQEICLLLASGARNAHRIHRSAESGFIVKEFCRTIRGQQGPGAYLLERVRISESKVQGRSSALSWVISAISACSA